MENSVKCMIFYTKRKIRALFSVVMVRLHFGFSRYARVLEKYYDFISVRRIFKYRFKNEIQKCCDYCRKVEKMGGTPNTKYYLCTTLIIKDEALYVEEWLEYYLCVGVDHFYIYDNGSSDDLVERLAPYIEKGLVTYIEFAGDARQEEMSIDCHLRFGPTTRWMMIADTDEYMLCNQGELRDFLKKHEDEYAQVSFRWFMFGSSNHETRPAGLLIENFLYRAASFYSHTHGVKSIFQPHLTVACWWHYSFVLGKTHVLDEAQGQCNHYYCKSWEEFVNKNKRGDVTKQQNKPIFDSLEKMRAAFDKFDFNEVLDERILPIARQVKLRLEERKKPHTVEMTCS